MTIETTAHSTAKAIQIASDRAFEIAKKIDQAFEAVLVARATNASAALDNIHGALRDAILLAREHQDQMRSLVVTSERAAIAEANDGFMRASSRNPRIKPLP